GNPNDFQLHKSIEPFWPSVPEYIKQFYATLHDGWYFLTAHSLGLLPSRDIKRLQDDEWGILDDIDVSFDLAKTVPFFYNGSSGYLCLNFEENEPTGILWWSDEAPTEAISFEDYLDEWSAIGMEN